MIQLINATHTSHRIKTIGTCN